MENSEFYKYILPNGIRCLYKKTDSVVAYCALSINVGSRDELRGEHGLAHFIEHCMFKGTTNRSPYDILSYVESHGGEVNAYTGKEETVIHATTLTEDIERAIDIISDVVFNSTFDQSQLDHEKSVIVDEINSYKDSYPESIYDDFEDLLFKGSTLGHNILGTERRLTGFTTRDIKRFRDRCYTTDMMVFSLFGNVSKEEFERLCNLYFGQIATSKREFVRARTDGYLPFTRKMNKCENQLHYFLGNRAYGMNDDDRLPALLLTNIFGGQNINSLLNVALREEHGLTYSVESSINSYMDTGIFSIYFTSDKKRICECLDLIEREIRKIGDGDFVRKILPGGKRQFMGQFLIGTENTEAYMLASARSYMIYDSIDSIAEVSRKIDSIATDDILRVADAMFTNMSTLIYK